MVRSNDELKEADEESLTLLDNSPYKDKLQGMGLFPYDLRGRPRR